MPNKNELPQGATEVRDTLAFLAHHMPPETVQLDFDRPAAISFLTNKPAGTYLIRPSTVQDSLAVSYVDNEGSVKHTNFNLSPTHDNNADEVMFDPALVVLDAYRSAVYLGSSMTLNTALKNITGVEPIVAIMNARLQAMAKPATTNDSPRSNSTRYTSTDDSNVMVISTQVAEATAAPISNFAPGSTGRAIHENVGGGMMHMHRDKSVSDDDKQNLQKHLRAEGWLIITGHGNVGGNQLSGDYEVAAGANTSLPNVVDVTHSPADFVKTAMQCSNLKKGDHINVLLYVCHAASSSPTSDSFSKKVAKEFAAEGINTTIVASINPVGRISELNKAEGDIENQLIRFRAPTNDIRILETTADMRGGIKLQREDKRGEDFVLSRHGIGFRSIIDNSFLESLKKKPESEDEVKAFASSLAYLVTRPAGRVLDDARAGEAKKIFAQLPANNKNRIMDEVKAISPAAYSNLATQNVTVTNQSLLGKKPPVPAAPTAPDLSTLSPTKKT